MFNFDATLDQLVRGCQAKTWQNQENKRPTAGDSLPQMHRVRGRLAPRPLQGLARWKFRVCRGCRAPLYCCRLWPRPCASPTPGTHCCNPLFLPNTGWTSDIKRHSNQILRLYLQVLLKGMPDVKIPDLFKTMQELPDIQLVQRGATGVKPRLPSLYHHSHLHLQWMQSRGLKFWL